MTPLCAPPCPMDDDHAALTAVALHGGGLCTVTRIDGSWSRRLGAQLAVLPDGTTAGSLADGCLERALAEAARLMQGEHLGHDILKLIDNSRSESSLNTAIRHHGATTEKQGRRGAGFGFGNHVGQGQAQFIAACL